MADPFVAEIRIFAGNFPPRGWATCDGQLLPIAQNTALFSLLGTNFGGDGRSTFGLPNLAGRSPMFWGAGPGLSERLLGEDGGSETVTLLASQMPSHRHGLKAALAPTTGTPGADVALSPTNGGNIYRASGTPQLMAPQTLAAAGGGQPHNNLQPFLALTFIIALVGIFPPRS